jgi:arylsulfatase A-like enzyme
MKWLILICAVLLGRIYPRDTFAGAAEHVVVLVWDGMRPDYVTSQLTPNLLELARRGTFFKHHHSSYVTSTEVNGAALATGMYPNRDGILANSQYRADLGWLGPYGTENFDAMRRGDLISGGRYLTALTVPEILQQAGFPTLAAGSKPVILLQDRAPSKVTPAQANSVTLFRGQTLPRPILQSLIEDPRIGRFPAEPAADSKRARIMKWLRTGQDEAFLGLYGHPRRVPLARAIDAWTTRALVHGLWKDGLPKYTLLWLGEPDASQHQSGPGSDNAKLGLAESDRNLGVVLEALRSKGVLDKTDVLVVSDHGFSTVSRGPDVIKLLKRAGFVAGKQFENPEPGDVMMVNLGGSAFFYVFEHQQETIRRLVEFLQASDFAGVIFSAQALEGTFPLAQVHLDAPQGAPDVVVSMRWTDERSASGAAGLLTAAEGKVGRGSHASLSRFDLHNTLVAAGPDFRQGFGSDLASGNIDVAPTVLAILGIAPPIPMEGRVLTEALTGTVSPPPEFEQRTLEASRDLGARVWRQFLTFTRVGSAVYFDEGNGESRLK